MIHDHIPFLVRIILLVGLYFYWPRLMRFYGEKRAWPKETLDFICSQRTRFLFWAFFLFVVVSENGFGFLVSQLTQWI